MTWSTVATSAQASLQAGYEATAWALRSSRRLTHLRACSSSLKLELPNARSPRVPTARGDLKSAALARILEPSNVDGAGHEACSEGHR